MAEQNTEKKAPMLPWAAAGPWCSVLPIHLKTGSRPGSRAGEADTFKKPILLKPITPIGECLLKTFGGAVLGGPPAGRGPANMALQGPVCWPSIAKSGRLCQLTWQLAMLT